MGSAISTPLFDIFHSNGAEISKNGVKFHTYLWQIHTIGAEIS